MLTFMHTYTPESWEGLVRRGLWRDGDGLKVMHAVSMPPEADFNRIAAPGAPLSRRLEALRCPFYIDRLQGGVALPRWFRFDEAVTARLHALLGENFWGWQFHEWSSNYRSDVGRLDALFRRRGAPGLTPQAERQIWQDVVDGREKILLEALTPEEWMGQRLPPDRASFLDDVRRHYARRAAMVDGCLIPADSYHMAPRIEIAGGAKLLLPEVGWQIPNLRIQLAYTRGMARAHGLRWGIYYECWCYNHAAGALTIPYSLREGQDEWYEDQRTLGAGADRTPEEREQGGTSRSLQARIWRYAAFAGASVIGEEYGVSNTFRDLRDFELSPYGETKRDFLRFDTRFPALGEPFTPIAVVLPKDLPILHVDLPAGYLAYPASDVSDGLDAAVWQNVRTVLPQIFGVKGSLGNSAHVLTPGGLPDCFDILHEDDEAALGKYDAFIDLTGGTRFSRTHRTITPEEADGMLRALLPARIDGIHTAFNRIPGGWLVFAANHDGVECDNFRGDVFLPEAARTAEIRLRDPSAPVSLLDGAGSLRRDGACWQLTLGAGDWALLRISER